MHRDSPPDRSCPPRPTGSRGRRPMAMRCCTSGDALEVLARIPDESVDCVWTDPPYLLSNGGVTCVAGRMVSVNKGRLGPEPGDRGGPRVQPGPWTAACRRVLKPAGTIWVSGTLHVYPSVGMALVQNGFRLLNDIVWEKPNPPPNLGCRTFTHSTELILWASRSGKGSRQPVHVQLQGDAPRKRRPADEDGVADEGPEPGREAARETPHPEADRAHRAVPAREHQRRRRRPRSLRGVREHRGCGARARAAASSASRSTLRSWTSASSGSPSTSSPRPRRRGSGRAGGGGRSPRAPARTPHGRGERPAVPPSYGAVRRTEGVSLAARRASIASTTGRRSATVSMT